MKRLKIWVIGAVIAAGALISYSFADRYFEISKNLDIFSSLFREVNIHYVDSVEPAKLMKTGIDAMLESLDPYTSYIPESDIEDYRSMTSGQYGGIGALIRQRGDNVIISDPYEGFPAQKSGLMAGDLIREIDGKSVKGKTTSEISRMLKGSPKTSVKLLIERPETKGTLEFQITRDEIKVGSVPYYGIVTEGIGYIRLSNFTEQAGKEVAEAMKKLKEENTLKGVILDLRGNPGGLLHEAVSVTNVFIDKGQEVVSTKGKFREFDRTYRTINTPVETSLPLVVLVNSASASASEIVSGSLQDLDRAVIAGQKTFGKGLVQTTRSLSYNSQLKITTSKYYIPSGRCIQSRNFSKRNEDGSASIIPDSMMSEFKTRNGRKVFDGGGIQPDVTTESLKYSKITSSLIEKNLVFDFANKYKAKNTSIAQAGKFRLSESDYTWFEAFISDKEYDYTTTSEAALEELKKQTNNEKYYERIAPEFEALRAKLMHNKQDDVRNNKQEISAALEEEIVNRYYFQKGRIQKSLSNDPEIKKCIEILEDSAYYSGLLKGTLNANEERAKH
ncbi:MAG: S41 family peptidase [Bacteroidetes bacterium]|nr:MAG: S41 family peptidase [Bacteroidota bacterium]REK04759.1 MAG: S41 family peptidase [Bacteroidota bacterium]REK36233.1 MAG: S41 family peptidase [Bacteroidota bacterium]REK51105.1 MAG: S41 family peptidase [Bacteroidota bacterium]